MHTNPDRLTTIVEALGIGSWTWTPAGAGLALNRRARHLLQLQDAGPINMAMWRSKVHPEDQSVWDGRYAFAQTAEHHPSIEYRIKDEGRWLWVEDRLAVMERDGAGQPLSFGGLWLCADARKHHEAGVMQSMAALENALQERRSAQSSFTDLAAVSDAWLWSQDSSLRFTRHSRGEHSSQYQLCSRAMLGRSYSEWLDQNPGIRDGADWRIVLEAQAAGLPFSNFVFPLPLTRRDGVQWCRISGSPTFDEAGQLNGYKGVGADITELYLARARAEEASQAKSAFLAHMSHEIRTPLHGVLGMAEVLETALEDPAQRQMIGTIRRSGQTLLSILNDILDMSKIEAGKVAIENIAFDPAELAHGVVDLHRYGAEQKGLELELLIGGTAAGRRLGDPLRVQQILHNLLGNAIKFTESGEVTIRLSQRPDRPLVLEVADTGIGMTDDQVSRLFDAFAQGDSSITRRFGGTGLGMAITRELVQIMGGLLRVKSAPGIGTTVRVELPLAQPEAMAVSGH